MIKRHDQDAFGVRNYYLAGGWRGIGARPPLSFTFVNIAGARVADYVPLLREQTTRYARGLATNPTPWRKEIARHTTTNQPANPSSPPTNHQATTHPLSRTRRPTPPPSWAPRGARTWPPGGKERIENPPTAPPSAPTAPTTTSPAAAAVALERTHGRRRLTEVIPPERRLLTPSVCAAAARVPISLGRRGYLPSATAAAAAADSSRLTLIPGSTAPGVTGPAGGAAVATRSGGGRGGWAGGRRVLLGHGLSLLVAEPAKLLLEFTDRIDSSRTKAKKTSWGWQQEVCRCYMAVKASRFG